MAGLKLRDVLGHIESLKAELRAARKDTEAQKSIVRGQSAELERQRVWISEQGIAIEALKSKNQEWEQAERLRLVPYVHLQFPTRQRMREEIAALNAKIIEMSAAA